MWLGNRESGFGFGSGFAVRDSRLGLGFGFGDRGWDVVSAPVAVLRRAVRATNQHAARLGRDVAGRQRAVVDPLVARRVHVAPRAEGQRVGHAWRRGHGKMGKEQSEVGGI